MEAGKRVLIGAAVIVLLAAFCGIGSYNSLIGKKAGVEEAYATIQADLQRRADLIPNLVETVKANADHETEVFTAITDAREELVNAKETGDVVAEADANTKLDAALGQLIVVAEAYPELQSSEAYQTLMTQLEGTENRISVSRKDYNAAVKEYDVAISVFPGNVFAQMMGFSELPYFTASEGVADVPSVGDMLN